MEEKLNPHHCHSCGYGLSSVELLRHSALVESDMKEQAEQMAKAQTSYKQRLERETKLAEQIMKENG